MSECSYIKDSIEPCKTCPKLMSCLHRCELLKDTINLETIEVAKVWQPTMMLRNVERIISSSNYHCEKGLFLQQMWTSNLGDTEWKDIPVENEF